MAGTGTSPVATPSVQQAFTLDVYCNSTTTDPLEAPVAKNGLIVPSSSDWGQNGTGYKAWRREWRAWQPGVSGPSPFWNPGLRKLIVGASTAVNSNYYAADGQVLTINLWDLQGPSHAPSASTAANSIVLISAYYLDASNQQVFIDAPFASYCWSLWNSQVTPTAFPARPTGQDYVEIKQPAGTTTSISNRFTAGPNTQQQMNVAALFSVLFNNTITAPPYGNTIKLQIAVYTNITPPGGSSSVPCYDDPEMDVGC